MKKAPTLKKREPITLVFGGSLPTVKKYGKERKKRERDMRLQYHELYEKAGHILCDAMKHPGDVLRPCPHCPGVLTHIITIYRDPYPPLAVKIEHLCPYTLYGASWGWGQWREKPLPIELVREIVYGPSLWEVAS